MPKDDLTLFLPKGSDIADFPFHKACAAAFGDAGLHVHVKPQSNANLQQIIETGSAAIFAPAKNLPKDGVMIRQGPIAGYWLIDHTSIANSITACAEFDHHHVDYDMAAKFKRKLAPKVIQPVEYPYGFDDFVLVVLTDHLGQSGNGANVGAVRMVEDILRMEEDRKVVVRWADNVEYKGGAYERMLALDLTDRVMFSKGQVDRLLEACRYMVTQNSDMAVRAMFHGKHAVLYAQTEFHHISRKVWEEPRLRKTYNRARRDRPEFAKYIHWLCQEHLIALEDVDLNKKILARIRALGM